MRACQLCKTEGNQVSQILLVQSLKNDASPLFMKTEFLIRQGLWKNNIFCPGKFLDVLEMKQAPTPQPLCRKAKHSELLSVLLQGRESFDLWRSLEMLLEVLDVVSGDELHHLVLDSLYEYQNCRGIGHCYFHELEIHHFRISTNGFLAVAHHPEWWWWWWGVGWEKLTVQSWCQVC